jgi:hypothetical protein
MKFLAPLRVLISPPAIAAVNLLILWPLVLSVADVLEGFAKGRDFREAVDIVSTLAIVMIGWGVALEERHVLRGVFGMIGRADEPWQNTVDQLCYRTGVGVLILGLFAEICAEMVHLPDRIINTVGREHELLAMGAVLLALCGLVLLRHIVRLVGSLWLPRESPGVSPGPSH